MQYFSSLLWENIYKLLSLKNISLADLKKQLTTYADKKKVDEFFEEKTGCDSSMLISLSKVFDVNINYFVEKHDRNYILNDVLKEDRLLILFEILGLNEKYTEDNIDELLLVKTKYALKNEIISFSYAAYLLNTSVQKVLELKC